MTDVRTKRPFNKIIVSNNLRKRRDRRLKDNLQDYKAVKLANMIFLFCILFEVVGIMTILFFGTVGAEMSIYFMTFLFSFFIWKKNKDIIDVRIKRVEPIKLLHLSAITVCGIPIALFLNYIAGLISGAGADSADDVNTYPVILALIVFAVVPAVVEEFVFRGCMLGAYSKVDVKAGILISSLFFALLHFSFGSVLYGFLFGLLFAVVRLATDNLSYTIAMHCLFNTINVLMSYISIGVIPWIIVIMVFVMALVSFIGLLLLFLRKNALNLFVGCACGKYMSYKMITKEGYVTMTVCIIVMVILIMQ